MDRIVHELNCVICGTESKMEEVVNKEEPDKVYRDFVFECEACGYKEEHKVVITLPRASNEIH